MYKFKEYTSFLTFLNADASKADLNPVRFINVDTLPTWVKVKGIIIQRTQEIIKLSEFCSNDDIEPNLHRLKVVLEKIQGTSLLFPLSEYLRVNCPLAKKTIKDILGLPYQNNMDGKLRLYIPLYRMKDVLLSSDIQNEDPRLSNTVSVIEEMIESDYSLIIIQKSLNININENKIDGFRNYFKYWEENPNKPITLYTEKAINYQDIVFADKVKVIVKAFELLCHFGMCFFSEEYGTEEQWFYLLRFFDINKKDIDLVIRTQLQINSYEDMLFQKWEGFNQNQRWLLLLWAYSHTKNLYLKLVLKNCNCNAEKFTANLYEHIILLLDEKEYWQYYEARKEIMTYLNLSINNDTFKFINGNTCINKLKLLTDCSTIERELIISTLSEAGDISEMDQILDHIYPLLAAYLAPIYIDNEKVDAYFKEYKKCKISNRCTDLFLEMVENFASEQGKTILELSHRNVLIEAYYEEDNILLPVDCFGIEYVSAFTKLFNDGYDVISYFGYCNWPSTTENNNDYYENKNHIEPYKEFDALKHSHSIYPKSIESELRLLGDLKKIVDSNLLKYKRVIVTSDHGSSRMAVLEKGKSYKASENAKVFYYGRFCVDKINQYNLSGCLQRGDSWVFLNYDKFSQQGYPICEIHGGGSLEETIVPVIIIAKKSSSISQPMKNDNIILLTTEVRISPQKTVEICFQLKGPQKRLKINVNNQYIDCTYNDEVYSFIQKVDNIEHDIYIAKIIEQGKIIGTIEYTVIRPMERNEGFDI
jgi:hypothetical protein